MQRGLHHIGSSNEKTCGGCNKEGTEKHRFLSLPVLEGGQKPDPRKTVQMGAKGQDIDQRLEVAERNHVVPSECRSMEEKAI